MSFCTEREREREKGGDRNEVGERSWDLETLREDGALKVKDLKGGIPYLLSLLWSITVLVVWSPELST